VRIATWNVNSVKQRVPRLLPWLDERQPDVVCLQETKLADDAFAELLGAPLAERGYAIAVHGEPTWNGVAILSRVGLEDVVPGLAGSPGFPQALWGSAIGENLDFTIGELDTDAINIQIAGGESNPILHLANARGLVALTTAGEFSLRGGQEKSITPTNLQVKDQSNFGTSQVEPERVAQEFYFVQRAGRKLRALSPNQYDDGQYVAPDMAVLAEHITESGIADLAYQAEPESLIYAVRNDGQLAVLTADRDQDVFAWTRQITQGAFEAVESVPTVDGDKVFVVVARAIGGSLTRFIERFEAGLHTDCAIAGSSDTAASTWGGLGHLTGRTVRAKGDGIYLGEFTVNGAGQITLPRASNAVEIGLDYVTQIETLTPEFMGPAGSSQGHQLSAHEVKVRLLASVGCSINLQEVPFRQLGQAVLDQTPAPFTGDKKAGNLGWQDGEYRTLIQQTLPYDFHVLAVITRMTANEG